MRSVETQRKTTFGKLSTKRDNQTQGQSAEPQKKLPRISSPEFLEDIDSDEELRQQVELAGFVNPIDRFQQNQTVITSELVR